ncbi:hypothetical protein CSB08_00110 [Candidatus Gracilibacteria bacterium]|nr:MAG: hypothetical protein CSB08_00110 [Candidatus Gracilibacteria bacterium]PIE85689.1 MAG: hypothetical protein CSA08_00630 [Candidatus Gracilibacteria bacterium]
MEEKKQNQDILHEKMVVNDIKTQTIHTAKTEENGPVHLKWEASFNGILLELVLVVFFAVFYKFFKNSKIIVLFDMMFEKTYAFFEDILGNTEKSWIKLYITIMFFIILFSNLLGVFLDFLLPIFGENLEHLIKVPSADINFNIAMAIIGVVIVIYEQFRHLGVGKFLYEYFPVLGKNYIPYEKGKMPKYIDYPLFFLVKIFDIIISLFLGILDIVGHFAKLISLSFRLFGNVTSGSMLLMMLVGAVSGLTLKLTGFEFPVIAPLLIYLQGLLVAFIQALVFPLLIAIFIKVAKVD